MTTNRWNLLRGPVLRSTTAIAIMAASTSFLARQEILAKAATPPQQAESPRIHVLADSDAQPLEGDQLTPRTFSHQGPYFIHTIQPGENLRQIASAYHTLPSLLDRLNPGASARPLPVGGTLLVIPSPDLLPYKAEAGDTVEGVAARYEIPVQNVTRIHGGVLQVGEEIYLVGAKPLADHPRVEVASRNAEVRRQTAISIAPKAPAGTSQGEWAWPVQVPILEFSEFGPRADMGDYHTGLDMAAPEGTPVVAAHSGRVVEVRWNHPSYGNYILIDHGDGIQTRYAHAEDLYVTVGQWVNKGTVIMAMGQTGRATGPHLHLEVLVNGTPVNPRRYLP